MIDSYLFAVSAYHRCLANADVAPVMCCVHQDARRVILDGAPSALLLLAVGLLVVEHGGYLRRIESCGSQPFGRLALLGAACRGEELRAPHRAADALPSGS